MSDRVEIVEMAARDGLQNEKRLIPTIDKIALIDRLSAAGYARIEAASFVSPKWVPQLPDGADVMAGIARRADVAFSALVPNMKGYAAARAADIDEMHDGGGQKIRHHLRGAQRVLHQGAAAGAEFEQGEGLGLVHLLPEIDQPEAD